VADLPVVVEGVLEVAVVQQEPVVRRPSSTPQVEPAPSSPALILVLVEEWEEA